MKIFLSYASEQFSDAKSIAISLRSRGYEVFFDESNLKAAENYDQIIESSINETDLLIFLISPEAVEKGRYTLSELSIAESRWKNPEGRVIPVLLKQVDVDSCLLYTSDAADE